MGRWIVVSYSIPEAGRDVRRLLRGGLRTMAFGALQGVKVTNLNPIPITVAPDPQYAWHPSP